MNAAIQLTLDLELPAINTADLTIAGALQIVATWTDLPPGRLQKFRTALATAARVLAPHQASGAATLPMNCASLSRLLQAPAARFGLTDGRMTSLCSELRAILRRLGLHAPDRRGTELQSPDLLACQQMLPEHRQLATIGFMRFLEAERIAPAAADGTTLQAYKTYLAERTLCPDPADRARQIASAWNWACQNVPGWPGQPLVRTARAGRYSFPFETYPVAFQRDVERYAARLRGDDLDHLFAGNPFGDDEGHAAAFQRPLRPASIENRLWFVRIIAGALVISGIDQQQITSLRDLVHPVTRCETILRFFLKRRGDGKSSPMAERVAKTLVLLARDNCRLPEADIARIANWSKRLTLPPPGGLTDKNTQRLRALMQPRARAMLLCFPQELMRQAAQPCQTPEAAARLAMYAVAMEILLICPMRRQNLADLRLDLHLHRPDPRLRRLTHIIIGAGEVKNAVPIHWPIPAESAALIETFIARHRPHLAEPANPFLFGNGGRQRDAQHLGEWLSAAVTRQIGVAFNVHLARHFAAWNFLRENPGQYEVVRQVLGHRNITITMAHYVGLEADSAAQHFDASVLRDRQAARKTAALGFRNGGHARRAGARGAKGTQGTQGTQGGPGAPGMRP